MKPLNKKGVIPIIGALLGAAWWIWMIIALVIMFVFGGITWLLAVNIVTIIGALVIIGSLMYGKGQMVMYGVIAGVIIAILPIIMRGLENLTIAAMI